MTRRMLTAFVVGATFTIACSGSRETGDELASASASARDATTAAATATTAGRPEQAGNPEDTVAAADRPDALPDTASPLALVALTGFLSLAGAVGLRALRS